MLAGNFLAAYPAVRLAGAGEKQSEVVVYFGGGGHSRTGIAAGASLLDCDSGGQAGNLGYRGFLHLFEELPGVGAERFDVFSSPLGVYGIERERAFARAADTGYHNHFIARDAQADIFEVMLGGPGYFDCFLYSSCHFYFK